MASPVSLVEVLDDFYELLERIKFLGFKSGQHVFEQTFEDLPADFAPYIKILAHREMKLEWTLNLDEAMEGSMGSIRSGIKHVSLQTAYKHRHDYVCEAISLEQTDKRLEEVFGPMHDDDDSLTPDYVFYNEKGDRHFVEVTTRTDADHRKAIMAIDEKMFKYCEPIRSRTKRQEVSTFTVVVVTYDAVFSNVELPIDLVSELIARMRIAVALERLAISIGINIQRDEREGLKEHIKGRVWESISSIKLKKPEHPLDVDASYIERCLSPPDLRHFENIILREMESLDLQTEESCLQAEKEFKADFEKCFQDHSLRMDNKSVCVLPFIISPQVEQTSDIEYVSISESREKPHLSDLWSTAFEEYSSSPDIVKEDPSGLLRLALEEDYGVVRRTEEATLINRKKYHRVSVREALNESTRLELAAQGVWGKRYRDRMEIKNMRINKKKGFRWSVPTNDIEAYLSDSDDFLEKLSVEDSQSLPLLQQANRIVGNNDVGIDIIKQWETTPLMRALDIYADIAYEVAISNKQSCNPGMMILKRLRRYKIYLLISPTNSREHTFVSVCAPGLEHKSKHDGVFGKMFKTSQTRLWDFVSFKSGKYENAASMPASLISLASFWAWFYELPDCSPSEFRNHPEAMRMLKLSLLVRCENKSQTEEVITAARYMYMEIFKSHFSCLPPRPFSVISKVPSCVRSRLALYLIRQLVNRFQEMSVIRPTRCPPMEGVTLEEGEDSLPADHWNGLLNWMTGGSVTSATMAVNLFYVGYLKDKNENPEGNTDFSLINKTVEEELTFDRSNYKASKGDCDGKPKAKQFDLESVKVGCSVMELRLQSLLGCNWKNCVGEKVIEALSQRMTSEIATLKASCSEEHKSRYPDASLSGGLSACRVKVLEAVHEKLNLLGLNPYTRFERFLNIIEETSKGVIADLFKKQQHGGLREIYVLTLESRIVQLFLETCSRVLCSYFEEETLTHPGNKTKKLDEHKYMVSRISNRDSRVFVDYCSSTDKTRWNQNFVMPAMVVPLIRLLPGDFHGAISRSINLWNRKLIKLPSRVQHLLLNNVTLSSDVFQQIKIDFWDKDGGLLFDHQKAQFVRLQTGMMQGILHYTSSLLHLTFLNATTSLVPKVLHRTFPDYKFKCTQVCSSDDSASILSAMSPPNCSKLTTEMITIFGRTARMLHVLDSLAPYFCMETSPKSNTANLDNIEFNSEFIFKNTMAVPIIKYVAASLNITEAESFNERFHTMYNLTSDLFQSGFPAENTHICQLAQGYNHYRTMGHSTSPLFKNWCREIVSHPEPSMGFFLLDTQYCPGVLGFSYAHWKAAKSFNIIRKKSKDAVRESSIVNMDGGIVTSLIVKHGDVARWKKMADNLTSDMDLRAEIEKNPKLLFYPPETTHEIKVSLAIKATMPAVAKSMRKGNPYMQALATTVYSLSSHCFSKTTVTQDLDRKLTKQTVKTSLLCELRRVKREEPQEATEAELAISFPHYSRYIEADEVLDKARACSLVKCHKFRHKKNVIVIQPMSLLLPINLKEICMFRWFDHRTRVTGKVRERCWKIYTSKLVWLKDTIKETLENSPFSSYQELANFVSSQVYKPRVFVRIGPSVHSSRFRGQLFQIIKKSQRVGHVMKATQAITSYITGGDVVSRTCLALSLPLTKQREYEVRRILTISSPLVPSLADVAKLPKREQKLSLIQFYLKGCDSEDIMSTLMNVGCGITYAYTKVQRREETERGVKWRGDGQCVALFDNLVVILDVLDEKCLLVSTNNWLKLKAHSSTLDEIFRELGLEPYHTPGNYIAKYNKGRLMESSPNGTRVLEDRNLTPHADYESRLKFQISGNSISLIQQSQQGPRTVVNFSSHPRDVTISPSPNPGVDYQQCWMNQKPLKGINAVALISKCGDKARAARSETRRHPMVDWIDVTLRARLCQKGLSVGTPVSHLTEIYVPDEEKAPDLEYSLEFLDRMVEKIWSEDSIDARDKVLFDFLDQEGRQEDHTDEGPEEWMIPGLTDEESQWCHVVNNLFEGTFEDLRYMGKKTGQGFRFLHPFWDDLINTVTDRHPRFWQQVMCGEVIGAEEDLCKDLQSILRLQKKTIIKSLSEEGRLLARNIRIEGLDDEDDNLYPVAQNELGEAREEPHQAQQCAMPCREQEEVLQVQAEEEPQPQLEGDEQDFFNYMIGL
nr:MAG: RNA-dependent RNA polymerase [Phenuiviridae-like virus 1]